MSLVQRPVKARGILDCMGCRNFLPDIVNDEFLLSVNSVGYASAEAATMLVQCYSFFFFLK